MIIGIDASRNKSGGAVAHIKGILNEGVDPVSLGIKEVHLWSYDSLLNEVEDKKWLIKHSPDALKKGIFKQVFWQRIFLPKEARKAKVDIMLYTDASAIVNFSPCVVMSRDMLSFEKGQMGKFGLSKSLVRLYLIKYLQIWSLNKATGALFLTKYAADVIMKKAKRVKGFRIIPHGVGNMFDRHKEIKQKKVNDVFKIIYVSNSSFYKHQWNIIEAISSLRKKGKNIELLLVGAKKGVAKEKVEKSIETYDPNKEFVEMTDYLNHERIIELTINSDIFIFASSCENMPNTLIEGMKIGMPILCSNRGPMPEVLKDGGIYFDPENIDEIKSVLTLATENYEKIVDKSFKAKEYASEYSWERCSRETYNYLIDIKKNE